MYTTHTCLTPLEVACDTSVLVDAVRSLILSVIILESVLAAVRFEAKLVVTAVSGVKVTYMSFNALHRKYLPYTHKSYK